MACNRPIVLADGPVPCGKCRACRRARRTEWAVRMMHERSTHVYAYFVTLTYRNDSLPEGGTLKKEDIVLWLKRLRRLLEPDKIRYFVSGEYGSRGNRPHYHAIVYSDVIIDESVFAERWGLGNVMSGNVTEKSCMYVAKYIGKQFSGKLARERYGNKERPFSLKSQGLGKAWLEKNSDQLVQTLSLTVNGRQVAIPRYYYKKLGARLNTEEISRRASERHKEYYDAAWAQAVGDAPEQSVAWPHELGQRRENDIKSKDALYKDRI